MPAFLDIGVRHNATSVARELSDMADRIERVPMEATIEAIEVLEAEVTGEIEEIAGGVYWDIESDVVALADGARGSVVTPKSKAHRIEPTKDHGILADPETGFFSKGGVNHPGSRPVDWIPGVSTKADTTIKPIFSEHMKRAVGGGTNLAMPVGGL